MRVRQSHWRGGFPLDPAIARNLRDWVTGGGSLTARLIAASQRFRVELLTQHRALPLVDEWQALGMRARRPATIREVLLWCDGRPAVFAHTVTHPDSTPHDWPFLRGLGNRSLGSALFVDPLVRRAPFEFARLAPHHPLLRRAREVTDGTPAMPLLARRSVFRRMRGAMLVTEVFLPALADHAAPGASGIPLV